VSVITQFLHLASSEIARVFPSALRTCFLRPFHPLSVLKALLLDDTDSLRRAENGKTCRRHGFATEQELTMIVDALSFLAAKQTC
jgi:hypothetical protein